MKVTDRLYSIYANRLAKKLEDAPRPEHVAVVCDGNRRWAKEAGFTDIAHGHRVGALKISELVNWCSEMDISVVTVYLLSTENLKRSPEEIDLLVEIIGEVGAMLAHHESQCKIKVVGNTDTIPEFLRDTLLGYEQATKDRPGLTVNIAVGYGGRQEIVDAVKGLVETAYEQEEGLEPVLDAISADGISEHLYTSGQPDPDLVIRTSGEQRLSGFLLWQSAYSEIWFTDTYWPAFRKVDFLRALRNYSQRHRRFGQ